MHLHNDDVSEYKTDVHQLKTICKTVAKQEQTSSLRNVFDNITRNSLCARDISFAECESSMHRARKTSQPKIPRTAIEFLEMLGTTPLGMYFQYSSQVKTKLQWFSFPMK